MLFKSFVAPTSHITSALFALKSRNAALLMCCDNEKISHKTKPYTQECK